MRINKIIGLVIFCVSAICTLNAQKTVDVSSPDGNLNVSIIVGEEIAYSVSHKGDMVLSESAIGMSLSDGTFYGRNPKLKKAQKTSVNKTIDAAVYKRSKIIDNYNELTLSFKEDFNVIFRAYNEGVAYRFVSLRKKAFEIENEKAEFNFPDNSKAYIPYVKSQGNSIESQYFNSFENVYEYTALSDWDKNRIAFSPLLVETSNNKKVCIAEADLVNYPGMFLYAGDKQNSLKGIFAPYPKSIEQGGHNELQGIVKERETYIAKYDKATDFPWRIIIVAENDIDLADNDMVFKLATPAENVDFSWVKPGKVAWEWWNDWNLYNVNFRTGVNNETYKYYIDFAAEFGIEYVILDEGWAINKKADLMQVVPEINLPELIGYGKTKNVGIILWAGYYAFERDMENVCKHYSEMGVKGFKIDFMDRDDQKMVDFHYRAGKTAAKYKMLVDFHGTYKPTGLQRTFPNVINFEGVHGLEQMKWEPVQDQVTYDVTIPFIRQIAGPVDYTQGAMRNAIRGNFYPVNSEPMSQGTRCRQLAQYVIFESPLNMLCDSPSNYKEEAECTRFIAEIPTVWDNTVALKGELGKYISMAREKDGVWYIGSMTGWEARTYDLDLSFLGAGNFEAEVFQDGINAGKVARDYKKSMVEIPENRKINISMAPGGGHILKITRVK